MVAFLIPLAIAAAKAGAGLASGNQRKQQQKGALAAAFRRGKENMRIGQADERQGNAEQLYARGLGQGGGIDTRTFHWKYNETDPKTLGPKPRDLASQYRQDVRVTQAADNNELATQYTNATRLNNEEARNNAIGSIASGIGSAFGVNSAIGGYRAASDPRDTAAAALDVPRPASTMNSGNALTANAFGGINPVNPLKGGAWGTTVDDFNVVGGRRRA